MNRRNIIISITVSCFVVIFIMVAIFLNTCSKYNKGIECFNSKDWKGAINYLQKLNYKDSQEKYMLAQYEQHLVAAHDYLVNNQYEMALNLYRQAFSIKPDNDLETKIKSLEIIVNIKKQKEAEIRKKQQEEKERQRIRAKIAPGAIYPIPTKFGEGYDNTIRRYGVATINRINKLAPIAAELIAQNPRCKKLSIIDVADDRSTRNKITFFADCYTSDDCSFTSIERFYISEDEIKAKRTPKSVKEQMQNREVEYLTIAEAEIKSRLNFPSTYKSNPLLNSVSVRPMGTIVKINFSAKNAFNLETKYVCTCTFNDKGLADINIQEKQ